MARARGEERGTWLGLSIPEREFLISGITPEEWAAAFPEDEEEEEEPKGDFHSERYGDW